MKICKLIGHNWFWKYSSEIQIFDMSFHSAYSSKEKLCISIRECSCCGKKEQRYSQIYKWRPYIK